MSELSAIVGKISLNTRMNSQRNEAVRWHEEASLLLKAFHSSRRQTLA